MRGTVCKAAQRTARRSPTGTPEAVIAIDGKTVRRSGRKQGDNPPIHMVSAFAARQRLVLGQVKVA
jgi:hypothetical protein